MCRLDASLVSVRLLYIRLNAARMHCYLFAVCFLDAR